MKEQIAKIIQDGVCSGDSSWDEITIEILKFMREPTEKMLHNTDMIYKSPQYNVIKNCWQAMIDAVIND